MPKQNDEKQPIIIIKKIKKVSGGHHGGAWKVAYADFVTAMMAFFLLLWLLNVTTDEQKAMISAYFAPADPRIATSTSGSGGVMGGTTMSPDGAMTSDRTQVSQVRAPSEGVGREDGEDGTKKQTTEEEKEIEAMDRVDDKAFDKVEEEIKKAIEAQPELKALEQNLLMDMTPEGLRIQIVDQEGKPMFETGSAKPLPAAQKLFNLVNSVVKPLPNKISLRGHTDSVPYGKDAMYTNWELSSDRANAARRVLLADGLAADRVENVQGKADREALVPNDPTNARNRRISVILMKQSITNPPKKEGAAPAVKKPPVKKPDGPTIRQQDPGVIYFP
ncbi:MAG TPA: flagellar motor protein MotB [Patescibacteria group bacterium]|nr:flagellar motor protein MotB [Patescibacteria group bacterium]